MEETEIPRSRFKGELLLFASFIMILILAWSLFNAPEFLNSGHKKALVIYFAPFGILIFGYLGVKALKDQFRDDPYYILSSKGILDLGTAPDEFFLPWSEITKIELESFRHSRKIAITLRDPKKVQRKLRGLQKFFHMLGKPFIGKHLIFAANLTTYSHKELYELMVQYFNASQQQETPPQREKELTGVWS
ncbi:hypothetical protein GUA87_03590 [Sneathiella sp. P13V-1]|uniref:STM3941 family protein n=1 Tax=Sneathiella sp. P13V-1 TaxID=2697366 RepID=UPI00187B8C07|nr:STM3941 family protein [Sneathiella sp. P13V-1]MBE7635912.1 hypothetical protein [Sneathiella sp. P13V-1]